MEVTALFDWLFDELSDATNAWSMGTFGAIGEFMRDRDEPAEYTRSAQAASMITARGGMRLTAASAIRAIAYETPANDPDRWSHGVALCLQASDGATDPGAVLTELGPDIAALREEDRDAILFDLGLAAPQVTACIRTTDPELLSLLRANAGRAAFEPGNPAMAAIVVASPHRIFITRIGRLEVYQAIPPADGRSPEGPHTHVLPKLLRSGRTHAATLPIPAGWVPCAYLFPPIAFAENDPLTADTIAHFQELFCRFGLPELVTLDQRVKEAVARGDDPAGFRFENDRHSRAAIRVALRKLCVLGLSAKHVSRWMEVFTGS